MIPIKSESDIRSMRSACRIAATVLDKLCRIVAPGVNTYDLDQEGRKLLASMNARSACFGYQVGNKRFPAHTCLSVNDEIVHGIGDLRRILREGDLISVDVCVEHEGFIGDNARTIGVGAISDENRALLERSEEALYKGIHEARPANRVGAISNAVERYIRPFGYGIIRDFVGHGVGRSMHEPPQIPNFGSRHRGERLKPGMTLAIEPMISLGRSQVVMADDGWTALTIDGSPSAHFEHTVLVTAGEPEILTVPDPQL
ncbi:type I methionyl aminopeptidase [Puniceicoccales bacterium CK1056]|uniref:Methionine aminopeptidase n=1 Tax=Oceanipulchritudo coccoides TaxID=2706888 RepID=A0A6B2M1R5_9BACT|nr:type I methionyl aminopeptidase [Oceanipulchritudo coccoides]NDV62663.1 type I methionyl aminopeptidase [Oceanipulchritudo coccoides]